MRQTVYSVDSWRIVLFAAESILYYKQVTEGYEDKQRFSILQKVGMDREELRKIVRHQVRLLFFLPLITAGIHLLFAFPVTMKMLRVFNLWNVPLYAACSGGVFLLFGFPYTGFYSLTARVYERL